MVVTPRVNFLAQFPRFVACNPSFPPTMIPIMAILVSECVHITLVALCTGTSFNDSHVSHEYHAHDNGKPTRALHLCVLFRGVCLIRAGPPLNLVFRHFHDIIYAILPHQRRGSGNSIIRAHFLTTFPSCLSLFRVDRFWILFNVIDLPWTKLRIFILFHFIHTRIKSLFTTSHKHPIRFSKIQEKRKKKNNR